MNYDKIALLSFPPPSERELASLELKNVSRFKRDDKSCDHAANKYLCLPITYSKFELPHTDSVNVVEIGIDISDVLRINDKVRRLVSIKMDLMWSLRMFSFGLCDQINKVSKVSYVFADLTMLIVIVIIQSM